MHYGGDTYVTDGTNLLRAIYVCLSDNAHGPKSGHRLPFRQVLLIHTLFQTFRHCHFLEKSFRVPQNTDHGANMFGHLPFIGMQTLQ